MHLYQRVKHPVASMLCMISSTSLALSNDSASRWQYESTVLWESRYVDSGRDDLEEGGIFSGELVCAHDHVSFGAWMGVADSEHYEEYNLFAGYGFRLGQVDLELAYTHLMFHPDSDNDDELSIAAEVEVIGGWIAAASGVYSFEADGCFVEVSLSYPLAVYDDRLWLTPVLLAGVDFGYRTAGHDGLNHIQIMIEAAYQLSERSILLAYVAHSDAQDDVQREGLGDVSWIGIGLNTRF